MSDRSARLEAEDVHGAKSVRSSRSGSEASRRIRQAQADEIAQLKAQLAEATVLLKKAAESSERPPHKPPDLPLDIAPPGMVSIAKAEEVLAAHTAETKARGEAAVEEVKHTAGAAVEEAMKAKELVVHEATETLNAKDLLIHELQHKLSQQGAHGKQALSEAQKMKEALQTQLMYKDAEIQQQELKHQQLMAKGQAVTQELAAARASVATAAPAQVPASVSTSTAEQLIASLASTISSALADRAKADKFGIREGGLKKVPRFEGRKSKADEASIWIKRLEYAAREDHWFTQPDLSYHFAGKLMTVVDDHALR